MEYKYVTNQAIQYTRTYEEDALSKTCNLAFIITPNSQQMTNSTVLVRQQAH